MNEKIKELYEECTNSVYVKTDGYGNDHYKGVTNYERFAELIVQECIKTIIEYDLVPGHSGKWEDIYEIHARLLQDLGEELKEHFGIE